MFADVHMRIEAIIAEGDTVAVRVFSEATHLGPLSEVVPATGKRFAARQSHWFRSAWCSLQVSRRPRRAGTAHA